MGDLVRHRPGRVTACSLSGEGRGGRCTTTTASDSVGRGGREGERGRRPITAAKRGGISRMWLELSSAQLSSALGYREVSERVSELFPRKCVKPNADDECDEYTRNQFMR